jgi:hypothetical protein
VEAYDLQVHDLKQHFDADLEGIRFQGVLRLVFWDQTYVYVTV